MSDTVSDEFFFYTNSKTAELKCTRMSDTASKYFFCYTLQENSDVHLQLNLKRTRMSGTFQINFSVTHCRKIAMFLCSWIWNGFFSYIGVLLNLKRILLLYFAGRKPYPFKAIRVERVIELELELQVENFNTKDNSVRSIWNYLTASPCYPTNTREREREREHCLSLPSDLFPWMEKNLANPLLLVQILASFTRLFSCN